MSTTYIRAIFKDDGGVAFDPTSVKLSDPTGAYGVKRNDTNAVVVVDDTAMTNTAVGYYEYSFTDPAYDLTYTAYIEYVIDGETYRTPKTVTGTTTPASSGHQRTLKQMCVEALNLLGFNSGAVDDTWLAGDGATWYARCKGWCNEAAQEFANTGPWPWLEDCEGTLSIAEDAWELDLPAGFRQLLASPCLTGEDIWLIPVTQQELDDRRADSTTSSTPEVYCVTYDSTSLRHKVQIDPPAGEAYTATIRYSRMLPALSADNDVPECPPHLHYVIQGGTIAVAEERHNGVIGGPARTIFDRQRLEAWQRWGLHESRPGRLKAHRHIRRDRGVRRVPYNVTVTHPLA